MSGVLDTSPIRSSEQLDWSSIERWLRERLEDHGIPRIDLTRRMTVEQFPGGHSNLTYLVRFGDGELVLRRPPIGPVPTTAHDMAREFRWLSAVHPVFDLAPRTYVLCDDPSVAGAVFYTMERRRGVVIRDDEPVPIKGNPALRRDIGLALVDALARLHAIDIEEAGLSHLGKPRGFVERQLRGWSERWERFKTSRVPEMEAVERWLGSHLPPEPELAGIVHGDYKLDNILLDAQRPSRIVAVFDWEMSALGDPLVDLGMLLAYWVPNAPPGHRDALTTVTDRAGWITRDELVERYARATGRNLDPLPFFEVFAYFKIAVVIQQIYYRYEQGQTDDPRFAALGQRVSYLAHAAARILDRQSA